MTLNQLTFGIVLLIAVMWITHMLLNSTLDKTVVGVALGIVLREIGNLVQSIYANNKERG